MNFDENFKELGERFREYLKYKGLKGKEVAEKSENSVSQITNILQGKVFGCNKLFNILNNYTDLNANWLFTGNGQMLNNGQNTTGNVSELKREIEHFSNILFSKQQNIDMQNQTIVTQNKLIDRLELENKQLKEEIEKLKNQKK